MAHGCLRGIETHGAAEPSDSMGPERDAKVEVKLGLCAVCDRSRQNFGTTRKAGRPERGSTRTAQFFWKRLYCQMNLLQALPAGANRVASISAASLSGSKGVLDPKAQVHARRGVTH